MLGRRISIHPAAPSYFFTAAATQVPPQPTKTRQSAANTPAQCCGLPIYPTCRMETFGQLDEPVMGLLSQLEDLAVLRSDIFFTNRQFVSGATQGKSVLVPLQFSFRACGSDVLHSGKWHPPVTWAGPAQCGCGTICVGCCVRTSLDT